VSSWNGRQYEAVSSLQREIGLRFVEELHAGPFRRVLDVGCGDGYLTALIAHAPGDGNVDDSARSVLGVDASPLMIERAQTRADAQLRFAMADVLSFASDTAFDLIVSINTLHWVTPLAEAFRRFADVQEPGGRLVVQLVGSATVDGSAPTLSIEDVAMQVAMSGDWSQGFSDAFRPYVHPTSEALSALVAETGYRVDDVRSWEERFDFDSVDAFERWCAVGMTAWTDNLVANRRTEFIREVVARYERVVGRPATLLFNQTRLSATRAES
jgi:trans-aconitate 2-methyltransferase